MHAAYTDGGAVHNVSVFVVKKQNFLEIVSRRITDPGEVPLLPSGIDFLESETLIDPKQFQQFSGPTGLFGSRCQCQVHFRGLEEVEDFMDILIERNYAFASIDDLTALTCERWIEAIAPQPSGVPEGEVEIKYNSFQGNRNGFGLHRIYGSMGVNCVESFPLLTTMRCVLV